VRKADNLIAICEPIAQKMWEPRRLTTLWATTACYRDSFTLLTASAHGKEENGSDATTHWSELVGWSNDAWRNTFQQLLPATIIAELPVGARWCIHEFLAISVK
jgi:hypothetical protein